MEPQEQKETPAVTPKKLNISIPAAIVTGAVVIALALVISSGKNTAQQNTQGTTTPAPELAEPAQTVSLRPSDHVRGDLSKAQVVVVEYSDSDCPYCQRFHATMKDVLKNYGPKVAWVYRYFPLDMHPDAHNEANALECVSELGTNETFWSYLDTIMDITVSPDKSKPILTSSAVALGIDKGAFESCYESQKVKDVVAAQSAEAQSLGAQGTPFSVALNLKTGKQVAIPGAYPIEDMKKTIDSLLK